MNSSLLPRPWSPHPSSSAEPNYFNLPMHALSATTPFLFMNIVTPTSTGIDKSINQSKWKPLSALCAAADAASSPPSTTPMIRTGSSPPFGVDPPRPPRDGRGSISSTRFWKWRSRSNKSASEHETRDISYASPMSSMSAEKQNHLQQSSSPYLSESAHVLSLQRPVQSSSSRRASRAPRLTPGSTTSQQRLADITVDANIETEPGHSGRHDASTWHKLIHRAKFRLKKHKSRHGIDREVSENTQSLPVDDSTYHETAVPGLGKTGTWLREEFGSGKRTKKIFGRAPWNRKDSTATFSSVSSSIREVLRGDTPPASPLLTSNVNAAYLKNKWIMNTFPGGEAVRVSTPPMDEDTADGKPRGFFGPLTPPEIETPSYLTPMPSIYASPKYNAHRMSIAVPSREWWEGKPQKPPRHGDAGTVAKFEFDVPEHLSNSPMCPANLRHKSGGTGLCVYHGRRRALSTVRDEGPRRQGSNSTS